MAPAAAVWFAVIVIVNVARSPQDTLPPEFAHPAPDTPDTTDTTDARDDNDQEGRGEREPASAPPDPRTPDDQC